MDKAVALRYDPGMPAPLVVASGRGAMARRIIELARLHGISCPAEPELVNGLLQLSVGEAIPEQYFQVVAELLVFVNGLAADETD